MAMSKPLAVGVITPWLNCWVTAVTLTPIPTLALPGHWPVPMALATISLNSARDFLKPMVLLLAMLWPLTSRLLLAAFRPERP